MKISVFGLGYVGCVSAACLTRDGHQVVGVDVDARKVDAVNNGNAPFYEPGLQELLLEGKRRGTLTATTDEADAIRSTDMALVCVGTPSERSGEIRLDYLRNVFTSIGVALRTHNNPFIVGSYQSVVGVLRQFRWVKPPPERMCPTFLGGAIAWAVIGGNNFRIGAVVRRNAKT